MSWVYALLTLAFICAIGIFFALILVWPIEDYEEDEHEQGGIG